MSRKGIVRLCAASFFVGLLLRGRGDVADAVVEHAFRPWLQDPSILIWLRLEWHISN
jgi:hypothetical protein